MRVYRKNSRRRRKIQSKRLHARWKAMPSRTPEQKTRKGRARSQADKYAWKHLRSKSWRDRFAARHRLTAPKEFERLGPTRADRRAYWRRSRFKKNPPQVRVGETYILPDGARVTVQRVRSHDAYVRAPYGSTWMPLSNLRDARRVKKVYAKPQRGRKRRIRRRNPEYTPEQLAYLDRRATWVKAMNKRIRAALDLGHFTYTDAYVAGSRIFIRGMPESQRRRFKSYAKKASLGKVSVSGADNSTLVIDTKKRNPSRRKRRNPLKLYSGLYKYTVAQKDLKVGSYIKALSTGETIKITKISGSKVTFSTPNGSVTISKKVAADNLGQLMYRHTHYGKGVEVGNLRFKYGGKVMTS